MVYRLQRFFFWNWVLSLLVLIFWFIYASLQNGIAVHHAFLGLANDGHGDPWPPWVFVFFNEALVAAWYILPAKTQSGRIRAVAAVFGLIGLAAVVAVPIVFSQPLSFGLELAISVYVYVSILAYSVFWPSDQAI